MTRLWKLWGLRPHGLMAGILALSGLATAGTKYVVTNDDAVFPFPTGVSFCSVGANGLPVFEQRVTTGGFGIGGGYFGLSRIAGLNGSDQQCIYSTEAGSGWTGAAAALTIKTAITCSPRLRCTALNRWGHQARCRITSDRCGAGGNQEACSLARIQTLVRNSLKRER